MAHPHQEFPGVAPSPWELKETYLVGPFTDCTAYCKQTAKATKRFLTISFRIKFKCFKAKAYNA